MNARGSWPLAGKNRALRITIPGLPAFPEMLPGNVHWRFRVNPEFILAIWAFAGINPNFVSESIDQPRKTSLNEAAGIHVELPVFHRKRELLLQGFEISSGVLVERWLANDDKLSG